MDSEPTRQAESKVIPPADPNIKFPEVAVIPPGQKSMVLIPKKEEVQFPKTEEFPKRENDQLQEIPAKE